MSIRSAVPGVCKSEALGALSIAAALIAEMEDFSSKAYVCPAGVVTIGYGRTTGVNGRGNVKLAEETTEQAESVWSQKRLEADLQWLTKTGLPSVELNANQTAALLSLIYNIGRGNFSASSLRRALLSGAGDATVIACWKMWNKARGRILQGLINRRQRELVLFLSGVSL